MVRLMWKIGVEGDKYLPHLDLGACSYHGCVPLTDAEIEQFKAEQPFKWQAWQNIMKAQQEPA